MSTYFSRCGVAPFFLLLDTAQIEVFRGLEAMNETAGDDTKDEGAEAEGGAARASIYTWFIEQMKAKSGSGMTASYGLDGEVFDLIAYDEYNGAYAKLVLRTCLFSLMKICVLFSGKTCRQVKINCAN